jgi:hypothetical protein
MRTLPQSRSVWFGVLRHRHALAWFFAATAIAGCGSRPRPRDPTANESAPTRARPTLARERGVASTDAAQAAVLVIFELLRDVVAELAPTCRSSVGDHANLPQPSFHEAVHENWRDGVRLIPQEWIDAVGSGGAAGESG